VTRTPSVQRGYVANAGPPGTTVQISGANFLTANETHDRSIVWWSWGRTPAALSGTTIEGWTGAHGFCIVDAGATVPDPLLAPNDPRWLHWEPMITPAIELPVWWNNTTSQAFAWPQQNGKVELDTRRIITSGNAALWWSWKFLTGFTPGSSDRVSFGWVTWSLLP
jgi:hypothetical protein